MENRERLFLNTVKGIAIFLMLWGHCIQYCAMGSFNCFDNVVYETIYTFHMPLFMLVSGYLFFFSFQKRDLKTLLIHRTQGMLQPIVFGTVLFNLLIAVMYQALSTPVDLTDGYLFSGVWTLFWFLWCVLASGVAVSIACKITDNGWLQGILLALGAFLVALFPGMDFQLFMYPFFLAGFFWAKHRNALARVFGKWKYAALLIYPVMLPFYNWRHYIYITPMYSEGYGLLGSLKIDVFRFLIGLAGSVFVMVLTDILFRGTVEKGRIPKLVAAVSKMGENSLQIYCLSAPLLTGYLPVVYQKLMEPFGYNIIAENWVVYNLIFTPLLAALYAGGLYFIVLIMRKLRIHALIFGR